MENYRTSIITSIANLEAIRNKLFDDVINVGMHGIHSDINSVFEPGDAYMFELEHFDKAGDPNLQLLVNLMKQIDRTSSKLLQRNKVAIEDVDLA